MMVRGNNKSITNDQIISFEVGGGDGFEPELGAKTRDHYRKDMGEELTNPERLLEIQKGRRLETTRKKQNHEDE